MKIRISPWKRKAREFVIEACERWRPKLNWKVEPARRLGDYVTVSVSDSLVSAETSISLRLIWKGGQRQNFAYLETLLGRLLDSYYEKHDALRNASAAAAQAWDATVEPREAKREIA